MQRARQVAIHSARPLQTMCHSTDDTCCQQLVLATVAPFSGRLTMIWQCGQASRFCGRTNAVHGCRHKHRRADWIPLGEHESFGI